MLVFPRRSGREKQCADISRFDQARNKQPPRVGMPPAYASGNSMADCASKGSRQRAVNTFAMNVRS